MEWTPIQIVGKPKVMKSGLNSGPVIFTVTLSAHPPREWTQFFEDPKLARHSRINPPQLRARTVTIRPPEGELKDYVEEVHHRVQQANEHYETDVVPKIKQDEERVADVARENKARLKRAQKEIDEL